MNSLATQPEKTNTPAAQMLDAVVIGAGFGGVYQLYRLLKDGLSVRSFEAAGGVGGVWYWNRYPGARVDSHFPHYQYWFSKELWDEGDWQETFPAQPEIERYMVIPPISIGPGGRTLTRPSPTAVWM